MKVTPQLAVAVVQLPAQSFPFGENGQSLFCFQYFFFVLFLLGDIFQKDGFAQGIPLGCFEGQGSQLIKKVLSINLTKYFPGFRLGAVTDARERAKRLQDF